MHKSLFLYLFGGMAMLNGGVLAIPLMYSLYLRDGHAFAFALSVALALGIGGILRYVGRRDKRPMSAVEGAWYMAMLWLFVGVIAMVPYIVTGQLQGIDAFFESMAALTTTGITVQPVAQTQLTPSLLLWRSLTAWLGGLDFMILFVTIVPLVSGGVGMMLSDHEGLHFSPMIRHMRTAAREAGKVYVALTIAALFLFVVAGLPMDAACHKALLTVSMTGNLAFDGIQPYTPAVELAATLVMLGASGNFLVYWKAVERRSWRIVLADAEVRVLLAVLVGAGLMVSLHLWQHQIYTDGVSAFRHGFFQVISFGSTSGAMTAAVSAWPPFDQFVLLLLALVGGCIGSAAGGMHVMRFMVLFRMAGQEIRRTLHPRMMIAVTINGVPVDMKMVSLVLRYFFLFMAVFLVSTAIVSLADVTLMQAMAIVIGCLTSTGATASLYGICDFSLMPSWLKLYCSFLMVLGRLEIFSFLIMVQTVFHVIHRRW